MRNKELKENEKKQAKVGSFGAIANMTKGLFGRMKNFSIKEAIRNSKKEDYMAAGITLAIIVILGIILWVIPATRSFITSMVPF